MTTTTEELKAMCEGYAASIRDGAEYTGRCTYENELNANNGRCEVCDICSLDADCNADCNDDCNDDHREECQHQGGERGECEKCGTDPLDVRYVVSKHNGNMDFHGVQLLMAFGGPNIWIDTAQGEVRGHWGFTTYTADIGRIPDAFNDTWEEYAAIVLEG